MGGCLWPQIWTIDMLKICWIISLNNMIFEKFLSSVLQNMGGQPDKSFSRIFLGICGNGGPTRKKFYSGPDKV
jgi:hypothetical protein